MDNLLKSVILTPFNILYMISPTLDLKILFFLKQRYKLNLKKPKTYNEKLQWIKINDRNPLMPQCCDKYAVRKFVENQGCGEILNRLIWEGTNPEEIPFKKLPKKCVIKVTHGSTFNIITQDSSTLNKDEVIAKCKKWMKAKFLPCYGEWFYGIEPPRVIIEDFIESSDDEQLRDYKVFCFNGIPRMIRVDTDRFTGHKMNFYDCNWNMIKDGHMGYPIADRTIEKPECLEKLLEYAAKLSKPFYHARVDFYITNNQIYFGEITFTNGAGFDRCSTYEFDLRLGNYLTLPIKEEKA